ncbi:MAG: hypothetical protein M0Q91_15405 [Methanoregula sp.]|jgi:hypothetical protein|nr:hypothetical protein [Methanoregula sp.]
MSTIRGADGGEYEGTHVLVPVHLKSFAKQNRISMSRVLREGLEHCFAESMR